MNWNIFEEWWSDPLSSDPRFGLLLFPQGQSGLWGDKGPGGDVPYLNRIRFCDATLTPGEVGLGQLVSLSAGSPANMAVLSCPHSVLTGVPESIPQAGRGDVPLQRCQQPHLLFGIFLRDLSLSPTF